MKRILAIVILAMAAPSLIFSQTAAQQAAPGNKAAGGQVVSEDLGIKLQNAASVAGLMLTTEVMISELPEPGKTDWQVLDRGTTSAVSCARNWR